MTSVLGMGNQLTPLEASAVHALLAGVLNAPWDIESRGIPAQEVSAIRRAMPKLNALARNAPCNRPYYIDGSCPKCEFVRGKS